MSERLPLYQGGVGEHFIITTDDQHVFRCSVELVGGGAMIDPASAQRSRLSQMRWVFEDARGVYNGPPFIPLAYLDELEALVNDWWRTKRALGQARKD